MDVTSDRFCFHCHKEIKNSADTRLCSKNNCIRTYHSNCAAKMCIALDLNFVCSFCGDIDKFSDPCLVDPEMWLYRKLDRAELNSLLAISLKRLKIGMTDFYSAVDPRLYPDYYDLVVKPMTLAAIEHKILNEEYSILPQFISDISWIHHNCLLYNGSDSIFSASVERLMSNALQDKNDIELCPQCYRNCSIDKENWFSQVCDPPHALVWLNLNDSQISPAKVLKFVTEKGKKTKVLVQKFGDHSKHKLNTEDILFLTENPPACIQQGGQTNACKELACHIENIKLRYGQFCYYPEDLLCSLMPILQMWLVNPAPPEAVGKARLLSAEPLTVQRQSLISSYNQSANCSSTGSGSLDNNSETLASKFTVELTSNPNFHSIFPMPFLTSTSKLTIEGIEYSPTLPVNAPTVQKSSKMLEMPTSSREWKPDVKFEDLFSKEVEKLQKKLALQQKLSLRTAFAMFREEVTPNLPEDQALMFLKACDTLQLKCDDNIDRSFQNATNSIVNKCAQEAERVCEDVIKKECSKAAAIKVEDRTADKKPATLHDPNRALVEQERFMFLKLMADEFVKDAEKKLDAAKSKRWCAQCKKEAQMFCCAYASYCNYDCQREHWSQHSSICAQKGKNQASDTIR